MLQNVQLIIFALTNTLLLLFMLASLLKSDLRAELSNVAKIGRALCVIPLGAAAFAQFMLLSADLTRSQYNDFFGLQFVGVIFCIAMSIVVRILEWVFYQFAVRRAR
jgi:hypothetical protein